MKTIQKSQVVVIDEQTAEAFQERYNAAMDELTDISITIEEKMVSVDKFRAVIMYSTKVRLPECLKDEYHLRGIYPTCSECPMYTPSGKGRGVCPRVRGSLMDCDEICNYRWMEMENEFKREVRIDASQFESRDGEAECDHRNAG